jgi:Carbohydrate-selective porin, OprB family
LGKLELEGGGRRRRSAGGAAPLFGDPTDALAAARVCQSRPGVSLNLEQQVNDTIGVFARAGWADGGVEPWDFADIDRTVAAGVAINGKQWGRPDDTIGLAGVINGLDPAPQAYFNAGGLGILIGDGQLPNYGLEQIVEAYYSYAISPAMKVSFDYQFIANPAYNTDRGPVNVFPDASTLHSDIDTSSQISLKRDGSRRARRRFCIARVMAGGTRSGNDAREWPRNVQGACEERARSVNGH